MPPLNLIGLGREDLASLVKDWGEPAFRAHQLYHAIYVQRLRTFSAMSTLRRAFRQELDERCSLLLPRILTVATAADTTQKFLLCLQDGTRVEMVHIPEAGRDTLCISSQAGCNAACRFCVTATMGLKRNLTAGEIVGQVLLFEQLHPGSLKKINLVFMGMGEPLLNYDAVMKSLGLLCDPLGMAISPRRITLSTCGIVPAMERLLDEPVLPRIAISLGASTNEIRDRLIPVNRKWPLEKLLEVCRRFPRNRRLTFEYTLIEGINDSILQAQEIVRLLQGLRIKLNIIPYNPHPSLPYRRPAEEVILRFQEQLFRRGISAFIRRPRGDDIAAACGQLAVAYPEKQEAGAIPSIPGVP